MSIAEKLNSERLSTLMEYMKIDKKAIDQEIIEAQEVSRIYKTYLSQLKKIKSIQDDINGQQVPQEKQLKLLEIMQRLPIESFREAEIIYYMLQLKTDAEMSTLMCITEKTIKFHKTNIFKKTGYAHTKELVRDYLDLGTTALKLKELPTGNK